MRKYLVLIIKVGLSIALVVYAFSKIDTKAALRLIAGIPPAALLEIGLILVAQQILASFRLRRLLAIMGSPVSVAAAVDANFIGVFFSQTFISFIGGDAMRVWRIMTRGVSLSRGARAVLLDRVAGFVSLIGLILAGLPFLFGIVSDPKMKAGIVSAVVVAVLATAAFLALSRLPDALRRWRILRLLGDVAAQTMSLSRAPVDLAWLLGLSLVIQVMNVLAIYAMSLALGVGASLGSYLILVPPVLLLAMLPISFAGWGVREGAMVVALGLVGVSAEHSVAMSVCFGIALIVIGLPGGLLWFVNRKTPAPQDA